MAAVPWRLLRELLTEVEAVGPTRGPAVDVDGPSRWAPFLLPKRKAMISRCGFVDVEGKTKREKKKNLFEEKGVHRKQESDNVCTLQHRDDSSKLSERVRNIESPRSACESVT